MSYISPATLKESGCTYSQLEMLRWILNLEPGPVAVIAFLAHSDKRTLRSLLNRKLVEYVPTKYEINGSAIHRPKLTKAGGRIIYRALGCG